MTLTLQVLAKVSKATLFIIVFSLLLAGMGRIVESPMQALGSMWP